MDWQTIIVGLFIVASLIGLGVTAIKSVRALARGKCPSRCSGCSSANEATVPHESEREAETQSKQPERIAFIPAGNLRNSSRDTR